MTAAAIDNSMQGQAAIVLGAGISGLAAARLLYRAGAKVTLADDYKSAYEIAAALDIDAVETVGKGGDVSATADVLILSPGISADHPLVRQFLQEGTPILSEIALAASFTEAPILAVTGSNGKSTVATLLNRMMAAGGYRSFLGGNIGVPFSDTLLEERTIDPAKPVHVVEVSSFQAEHLGDFSPTAAIFLNLSPDHLNRYADMQAYGAAKLHLQDNLMEGGWIIYNREDEFFRTAFEDHPRAVPFGLDPGKRGRLAVRKGHVVMGRKKLAPLEELSLPGPHNLSNMLAAATAATLMGVDHGSITQVMRTFQGLAHRLELLATINGINYYNDSKATNIASTRVALASFTGNIVLILGGSSKGGDFGELRDALVEKVRYLVTYGEVGLTVAGQFQGLVPLHYEPQFQAAVNKACDVGRPGDIVLLSPACASYDQFDDFAQRGDAFRMIVSAIEHEQTHA